MSDSTNVPRADNTGSATRHQAGWFDIRNVIGLLMLIYGVVLILMGLFFTTDADKAKTDDINANLWTGLGILLSASSSSAGRGCARSSSTTKRSPPTKPPKNTNNPALTLIQGIDTAEGHAERSAHWLSRRPRERSAGNCHL